MGTASPLCVTPVACVINQDATHHLTCNADEVSPVLPFYIPLIDQPQKGFVNQREIEVDTASFPVALRAALRQDPDVILVGEMRDLETIQTALLAAETGHMVFSTLHTNDAVSTPVRLLDMGAPRYMVSL